MRVVAQRRHSPVFLPVASLNEPEKTMSTTNDNADKALLPAGMADVLPPDAAFEATVVERLMARFGAQGYGRVKPPLLEFEENLLRGPGSAMSSQTFRLMDPVSQRMMGLRADMTPQVARIATSRLRKAPRPLRLSYAGQVLRVKGSQLRGERQFGQVGVEVIGAVTPAADAEIILMAASALTDMGVESMSVDLCLPTLVPAICQDLGINQKAEAALRTALDRKDAADLSGLAETIGDAGLALFSALLAATGPAEDTLTSLAKLSFGPAAAAECDTLAAIVAAVRQESPDLVVTIDPVENRGWEYHTGVTYTFFTRGVRGELGAGGRYITDGGDTSTDKEHSTGLTLFMDTLLRAIPSGEAADRIFMPYGTSQTTGQSFRDEGWITVFGLEDKPDIKQQAAHQECGYRLENGKAVPL